MFYFALFPKAIVAIAKFLHGWISSVMSGRIYKAVVMVGMILSRFVVSMVELGVEMDWSPRWMVGLGHFIWELLPRASLMLICRLFLIWFCPLSSLS